MKTKTKNHREAVPLRVAQALLSCHAQWRMHLMFKSNSRPVWLLNCFEYFIIQSFSSFIFHTSLLIAFQKLSSSPASKFSTTIKRDGHLFFSNKACNEDASLKYIDVWNQRLRRQVFGYFYFIDGRLGCLGGGRGCR